MTLDEAYKYLTTIRPCGPKRDAIRAATYDLLGGGRPEDFARLGSDAYAALSEEQRRQIQVGEGWQLLSGRLGGGPLQRRTGLRVCL